MFKDISSARNGSWESISDGHRVDDEIYTSDEFRMFAYKIKRCPRTRSHDWTECPYAHRGEKAQRRDPRRFRYSATVCAAFRDTGGTCPKGDACECAHGVFEYWLHPAKYRTRACNAGSYCQRKVCFFAHSPDQLRPETTKYNKTHHHHHHTQLAYRPTTTTTRAAVSASPRARVDDDPQDESPPGGSSTPDYSMNGEGCRRGGYDHHKADQQLVDKEMGNISEYILMKNLMGLRVGRDHETNEVVIRVKECGYDQYQIRAAAAAAGLGLEALSGDEELQRLGWISELLD